MEGKACIRFIVHGSLHNCTVTWKIDFGGGKVGTIMTYCEILSSSIFCLSWMPVRVADRLFLFSFNQKFKCGGYSRFQLLEDERQIALLFGQHY